MKSRFHTWRANETKSMPVLDTYAECHTDGVWVL